MILAALDQKLAAAAIRWAAISALAAVAVAARKEEVTLIVIKKPNLSGMRSNQFGTSIYDRS